MALVLNTDLANHQPADVRNTISVALASSANQAHQRLAYYTNLCQQFEQEYGFASVDFMQKFQAGLLGDDQSFFDWYAAYRGFTIWKKRYEILASVTL